MRLVAWNVAMKAHSKLPLLVEHFHPDVAVISECAMEDVLRAKCGLLMPECSIAWVGDRPHKGLAVVGFGDYHVALSDCFDKRLQWLAPVDVTGPVEFALLGVWAMNHRASEHHPEANGLRQPGAALSIYHRWLSDRDVVMTGDFNDNVRWDKPGANKPTFADTLAACGRAGLISAYHEWFNEAQGHESRPTLYWMTRKEDGPKYHIDFAFIPETWRSKLTNVEVGDYARWVGSGLSDHAPVLVDIGTLDRA
jgi:exodeoxyribonuclease-3